MVSTILLFLLVHLISFFKRTIAFISRQFLNKQFTLEQKLPFLIVDFIDPWRPDLNMCLSGWKLLRPTS